MKLDLADDFRVFREADATRLHFAAHSHHFWPDAAIEAQAEAARDAARLADRKWEHIFGNLLPRLQARVAAQLGLGPGLRRAGDSLAFGPNTHEFVRRLYALFPAGKPVRVLTTDSEFHSFTRQTARLEEEGLAIVTRVPAQPFASFAARLAEAARSGFDMAFVSHVFFNSGAIAGDPAALVAALAPHCAVIAIDGYHAFMALPLDLAAIEARAFYLAGGYKYAMAGEGACFIHVPPGEALRPRDTGWFAAFGHLQARQTGVPYADDGARFLGATFDPSGLYRLDAVLGWFERRGLAVAAVHAHVLELQRQFVAELAARPIAAIPLDSLITPFGEAVERGHFLTFEFEHAASVQEKLMAANIVTDRRDRRLRFGFGCYHREADIAAGLERMREALA